MIKGFCEVCKKNTFFMIKDRKRIGHCEDCNIEKQIKLILPK